MSLPLKIGWAFAFACIIAAAAVHIVDPEGLYEPYDAHTIMECPE